REYRPSSMNDSAGGAPSARRPARTLRRHTCRRWQVTARPGRRRPPALARKRSRRTFRHSTTTIPVHEDEKDPDILKPDVEHDSVRDVEEDSRRQDHTSGALGEKDQGKKEIERHAGQRHGAAEGRMIRDE